MNAAPDRLLPLMARIQGAAAELSAVCDVLDNARNAEIDALFTASAEQELGEAEHSRRLHAAERASVEVETVRAELTQAIYRLLGCAVLGEAI